jgi:catechol 2,3-dioxygenase-like lactoylglutathione lyase family enzyme
MKDLNCIWPLFIIANLKDSVAFYVDKLGFEVRYIGPDDNPFWAVVGRDDISIMLKVIADDIKPVPNYTRHPWASWDAYINATDPGALYEEYQSRGVAFHRPLNVNGDRLLGFEVADADGYILFFGRPEA